MNKGTAIKVSFVMIPKTLFGRNWGTITNEKMIHFEVCYYRAIDFALSKGITQVHDMGSFSDLITYQRALSSGELKIRVKLFTWYTNWEDILEYVKQYGPGNDWLKWDGVKGMIVGALGS